MPNYRYEQERAVPPWRWSVEETGSGPIPQGWAGCALAFGGRFSARCRSWSGIASCSVHASSRNPSEARKPPNPAAAPTTATYTHRAHTHACTHT
jgi:hypothetical protein